MRTRIWSVTCANTPSRWTSDWGSSRSSSPNWSATSPRRLSHETQSLREEIKRRNDDTRNTIERMFAEFSSVKTDRNLLAGLFVEIAKCLNQDIAPKRIGKIGNGD